MCSASLITVCRGCLVECLGFYCSLDLHCALKPLDCVVVVLVDEQLLFLQYCSFSICTFRFCAFTLLYHTEFAFYIISWHLDMCVAFNICMFCSASCVDVVSSRSV